MVSRSETARALLTTGEIMNLPHHEEIVMVSGLHPIRANKARFYEDARLAARILPPPDPDVRDRPAPSDDWSALAPIPEPELPTPPKKQTVRPGKRESPDTQSSGDPGDGDDSADESDDNDDVQNLMPEHSLHIPITPPIDLPANEFDPDAQDEERRKLFARSRNLRLLKKPVPLKSKK